MPYTPFALSSFTPWQAQGTAVPPERIAARPGGTLSSRYRFLPYYDDFTDEDETILRAYTEMLRDDTVKAALLAKIYSVSSLDLQLHPADPAEDARNRTIADFCLYDLQQQEGGVPQMLEEIFLPGLIRKYSICEIVRRPEPVKSGRWQGKRVLRCLKAKEFAWYEEDAFGNVTGVHGQTMTGENETYPLEDFVVFRNLTLFGKPISDLRAVYRWFVAKDTLIKLWLISSEKFGDPFILAKYGLGDDATRKALEAELGLVAARKYLVVPDNAQIDPVQAMSGAPAYEQALDRCDKGIRIAINGAFLDGMTSLRNDRGNSEVQQSTTELFIWRLKVIAENAISQQIVPREVDLNFANADYPRCTLGSVNDQDLETSLRVDKGLQEMGFKLSKKDRAKYYGRAEATDQNDILQSTQQGMGGLGGLGGLFGGGGGGLGGPPSPTPPGPPGEAAPAPEQFSEDVAPADEGGVVGDDTRQAERLLAGSVRDGTERLYELTRKALSRLLSQGPGAVLRANRLFEPGELEDLAGQLGDTLATAELLGRARILKRAEQAQEFHEAGGAKKKVHSFAQGWRAFRTARGTVGAVNQEGDKAYGQEARDLLRQAPAPQQEVTKVTPKREARFKVEPEVHQEWGKLFPEMDLSRENVAKLIGATNPEFDIEVSMKKEDFYLLGAPVRLTINANIPGQVSLVRRFHRDSGGDLICRNMDIKVDPSLQRQGIGAAIFANQVEVLSKMGVKKIQAMAAQIKGEYNGGYTWAALGYNGNLSPAVRTKLMLRGSFAKTLHQLMATKWGRTWWEKNASTMNVEFDLTPGSPCIQALQAYLNRKGITPMQFAEAWKRFKGLFRAAEQTPDDGMVDLLKAGPILLDDEDRAIIDEIWDDLYKDDPDRKNWAPKGEV